MVDMLRQHNWGVQFQQTNVCLPGCRQLVTKHGVADDLGHLHRLIVFIEPQLSNLDSKVKGLNLFPGRQDNEPSEGLKSRENQSQQRHRDQSE